MTGTELKDLFDRAVEPLGTMPDAVPATLIAGRRSVRRKRVAGAAGSIVGAAAAVAGIAGALTLADGGVPTEPQVAGSGEVAMRPTAGPSVSPALPSTPPTVNGSPDPKGDGRPVPEALRSFHRKVAPVLDAALPDRFGAVTADRQVHGFTVRMGDLRYGLTFRVDADSVVRPPHCDAVRRQRAVSCVERTLPDGSVVVATHELTGSADSRGGGETLVAMPTAETTFKANRVSLYMFPDTRHPAPVPISDQEMIAVLADPGVASAIREWASHPDWTDWSSAG